VGVVFPGDQLRAKDHLPETRMIKPLILDDAEKRGTVKIGVGNFRQYRVMDGLNNHGGTNGAAALTRSRHPQVPGKPGRHPGQRQEMICG
jgi:hypothetical protein